MLHGHVLSGLRSLASTEFRDGFTALSLERREAEALYAVVLFMRKSLQS